MSAKSMAHTLMGLDAANNLPVPSRLLIDLAARYAIWRQNHRSRCDLARLSKHHLSDIGLDPRDAALEIEKPFYRY